MGDVFFLLIAISFVVVLLIGAVLYISVFSGQFEDIDRNATEILRDDDTEV